MKRARLLVAALSSVSLAAAYACSESSTDSGVADGGGGAIDATLDGPSSLPDAAGIGVGDASTDARFPSRYAAAVLADHPIAYFRLDETTGSIARSSADAGGASYDLGFVGAGIALGMPSLVATDPNSSFGLDGGGHLRHEGPPGAILDALTIEAWVRPERPTTFGVAAIVSTAGNGRDPGFSFFLRDGDAGAVTFAFHTLGAQPSSLELPFDGKAHHVAAVFAAANVTFFLDGRSNIVPYPQVPLDASYAVGNLAVGRFFNSTQGAFAGGIDEVAIYPLALPVARLEAHWQAAISP